MASGSPGYGYEYVGDPAATPAASAAACAAWVRLNVNGNYVGVYVNAEQRDKQFLKNRNLWTSGSTWFYKQEDVATVALEEGNGESPTATHLCYVPFKPTTSPTCGVPPDTDPDGDGGILDLATDLNERVNMKAFLAMCAADAVASNNDGLCSHGNNMFFADFLGGPTRMYFPWDLDSVFASSTTSSIYVRSISRKGVVTQTPYQSVILNHAGFRYQYNATLLDLTYGPLSADNLNLFLRELELTGLPAALASDPYPTVIGNVADHFTSLRTWIAKRITNIQNQVAANGPPVPRN
jgi:hypothetical protein